MADPIKLTPIRLINLFSAISAEIIAIELVKAPDILYTKPDTFPLNNISRTLFRSATEKPSLYPKTTKVTRTTIFENPNLIPGAKNGNGIRASNRPMILPREPKSAKNTNFLVLLILVHQIHIVHINIVNYLHNHPIR